MLSRPVVLVLAFVSPAVCVEWIKIDHKEHGTQCEYAGKELRYGNFDIIWNRFSRINPLRSTAHAPCATLYLVPLLLVC